MTFPQDRPANAEPTPGPQDSGTPNAAPSSTRWAWVPTRSLGARHRDRIMAHLVGLDEADRYLRFGYPATDAQIAKYVDMLDFDRDEVFGIFNRRLELIALAHLAMPDSASNRADGGVAEFGVSVVRKARGRGFGARLFEHAMLHARNRGVQTLTIHALSENAAMLRIARNAGATIERAGPESEAWVRLPPDTLASHVEQIMGDQAAEVDYHLKLHASHMGRLLDIISEVKANISKSAHIAGE
ncbi:MAG: GNAT family N-acetyltransferase [Piscinibacter sp.]|nr:GNAT family N-acetyltransferase [Piscinibacter defluvii]MCW5667187.1 GNAT family N-acetyltransferase [Piscinibacter sp.]